MKHILLRAFFALCLLGGWASAQTIQLKITLNAGALQNPDCWLNGGAVNNNKVYIHSGLCTSSATQCFDSICAQGPASPWEHVVGNWGLDDNVGLMTYEGSFRWSITMIPTTYYNTPGATPYTIGLVFRNDDGSYTAKDGDCKDIFIKGIDTNNPQVVDCANQPFTPVTVERTVLAGVNEPSYLSGLVMSPNPFSSQCTISYSLHKAAKQLSVRVFSSLGQEVVTLANGSQAPGAHQLTWDGRNTNGQPMGNGLYYMVMTDGNKMIATEKMLLVH
jgi:hypothetical protein